MYLAFDDEDDAVDLIPLVVDYLVDWVVVLGHEIGYVGDYLFIYLREGHLGVKMPSVITEALLVYVSLCCLAVMVVEVSLEELVTKKLLHGLSS